MTMLNSQGWLRTAFLTGLALLAFASNSVLCRMALREATVDAASFSTIRLASGAAVLLLIAALGKRSQDTKHQGNWTSPTLLFLYAVPFSFAYISLATATGALILFAAVQATMILVGLWSGERPHYMEWVGHLSALVGLVYLVFPGLSAPSPMGSFLMMIAGIAWGVYSLRGRGAVDPIADTTNNFVRSLPFVIVISLITLRNIHVSAEGVLLAVLSGALASGVGYVVWYAALRGLTATRAAMVQLSVPVLAAAGGVIFLSEDLSIRLLLSATMILGGIGLAVAGRGYLAR